MAEESAATTDRLELRLDRLEQGQQSLREDVAELKGETRQITQRVSNVEQNQRQMMAILVGTWITTMLAIVGLYFKG